MEWREVMGIIKKLDIQLTNMIAAGEVVERPMGIVKELIENSIDAQATRIEVAILQGGIESIVIQDNGVGMDKEDAKEAFERHATSKISKTQDLWSIQTLGFRGEALPSIASVAHVLLHTNNTHEATQVEIKYGELLKVAPFPCNPGTRIEVKGLFHRTPARLKHLKTVPYENSKVMDVIQKFALSHPEIAFVFTSDGKELLRTSGGGDLLEVVYQLYGKEVAKHAIQLDKKDMDYHLKGLCIHPQFTRSTRNAITIFLNGRMVKPYRIQKAIEAGYREYIPQGRYPIVVLNIHMDSQLADVNVHPSKWEVRLSKEQQLEHLIKEAIPEALRQTIQAPEVAIEKVVQEKREQTTLFEEIIPLPQKQEVCEKSEVYSTPLKNTVYEEEPLVPEEKEKIEPLVQKPFPFLRVIGQLHGKYILCEGDEGLYIIDQHAAQERVNFEKFRANIEQQQPLMEQCLIPVMIQVSKDISRRLDEINVATQSLGIQFELFGNENFLVRETPVWMKKIDAAQFLQDLIDSFKEGKEIKSSLLRKDQIATMACHHSIRFNRVLSDEEMIEAVNQLSQCIQPYHCPHGRPTFICLVGSHLEKEFLR